MDSFNARLPEGQNADASTKDEIGVLFVHGIGQQRRGETLVDFGEPLHDWVRRWLKYVQEKWLAQGVSKDELHEWFTRVHGNAEKHEKFLRFEALRPLFDRAPKVSRVTGRRIEDIAKAIDTSIVSAQVRLNNAALLPIPSELQAPPQASLDLMLLMADGSVQKATWLLAESWWADSFTAPRFQDLAKWGLLVLPWTVSAHFGARVRRAFKSVRAASGMQQVTRGLWALLHSVEFVVGLVLVLSAIEVVLVLLLILSSIRISWVGQFVAFMQRQLADVVGDSYAVVARPIQTAAITGHIRRDLDWLGKRCQNIIIVAHSQGAALAHLTLRSNVLPAVKTLLTFGSGLRKLEELRLAEAATELTAGILTFAGMVVAIVGLALFAQGVSGWVGGPVIFLALVLLAGGTARVLAGIGDTEFSYWAKLFKDAPIAWHDYYASADPVPNGPLLDDDEDGLLGSVEVRNRASVLGDHTTYWENVDQFISAVACAIGRHSSIDLTAISLRDQLALSMAHDRRRWRVGWLRGTKWVAAALTIGVAYAHWTGLAAIGASLRTSLPSVTQLSTIGPIHDALAYWNLLGTAGDRVLGVATVLTTAYFAYVIVRIVWEYWNRADVDVLFSRRALVTGRSGGLSGSPFFAFCAVAAVFAAIGVSVLLAPFWSVIGSYPAVVLGADLVIGLLLSVMVWKRVDSEDKRAVEAASQSTVVRFTEVPSFELSSAAQTPRDIPKQPRNMTDRKDPKEDKS